MSGQQSLSLFLVESNSYDSNWWKNIKNKKMGPITQSYNWCLLNEQGVTIFAPYGWLNFGLILEKIGTADSS